MARPKKRKPGIALAVLGLLHDQLAGQISVKATGSTYPAQAVLRFHRQFGLSMDPGRRMAEHAGIACWEGRP